MGLILGRASDMLTLTYWHNCINILKSLNHRMIFKNILTPGQCVTFIGSLGCLPPQKLRLVLSTVEESL